MLCHRPAPDTSNHESIARAQQEVEFSASVSERPESRQNLLEGGSDRGTMQESEESELEESELEELRSRSNGRRRIRKRHHSIAVINRGQEKVSRLPLESIWPRNDFRFLDAPAKDTLNPVSQLLSARNTYRRSTLSNASINPNGLGRIPKSIQIRPPTPPSPVCWRESSRRHGPLNGDMRRIDSDYLLSKEFVHDINEMLDKIRGWQADLVEPYELSFQQDADNSERQVQIVEFGQRVWVVKIANPNKLTWRSALDDSTFADLPEDCQVNGCDFGCPRAITRTERHFLLDKKERLHPNPLKYTKGSGISPDLPRIFGQQSSPVPALRWDLLGYRGLKYPTGFVEAPLKPTEKRSQHFKACSPPKRVKQDDTSKGESTSSAATCTIVTDRVRSSDKKDALNLGVAMTEGSSVGPISSAAVPTKAPGQNEVTRHDRSSPDPPPLDYASRETEIIYCESTKSETGNLHTVDGI